MRLGAYLEPCQRASGGLSARPVKGYEMSIVLWIVQVLLALAFIMAGSMKLVTPIAELAEANMTFVNVFPEWFVRFLGVAEVAGGIGLIVPAATRIMPRLTPLAAFLLGDHHGGRGRVSLDLRRGGYHRAPVGVHAPVAVRGLGARHEGAHFASLNGRCAMRSDNAHPPYGLVAVTQN